MNARAKLFATQPLSLLGDVVIAPDGLDVVVLLERVDQLHQARASSPRTSTSVDGFQPSFAASASPSAASSALATSCRLSMRSRCGGRPRRTRRRRRRPRSPPRAPCRHRRQPAPYSIRPSRSKPWLTLPPAPRLPPFFEKTVRTLVAVRLRLSVSASTIERDSAGAEALVADFLVILGVRARGLVDRALDIVLGHRLGAWRR